MLTVKVNNPPKGTTANVCVHMGNMVVFTNTCSKEMVLKAGMTVLGFGQVTWKKIDADEQASGEHVLCKLLSGEGGEC